MGFGDQILAKLTARNIIAITFVFGYFAFLFGVTGVIIPFPDNSNPIDLEENPVITLLLGILSAALMLITQFFFRRSTPT